MAHMVRSREHGVKRTEGEREGDAGEGNQTRGTLLMTIF